MKRTGTDERSIVKRTGTRERSIVKRTGTRERSIVKRTGTLERSIVKRTGTREQSVGSKTLWLQLRRVVRADQISLKKHMTLVHALTTTSRECVIKSATVIR